MTVSEEQRIETSAGAFNILTWPGDSDPVLVIHGVSSTNRLWIWLHRRRAGRPPPRPRPLGHAGRRRTAGPRHTATRNTGRAAAGEVHRPYGVARRGDMRPALRRDDGTTCGRDRPTIRG